MSLDILIMDNKTCNNLYFSLTALRYILNSTFSMLTLCLSALFLVSKFEFVYCTATFKSFQHIGVVGREPFRFELNLQVTLVKIFQVKLIQMLETVYQLISAECYTVGRLYKITQT